MSNENAEIIQTEQVTPAPVTAEAPAKAKTDGAVSEPVVSPTEKQDAKVTAAFIKQRQELRELKAKLSTTPIVTPPPATPATTEVAAQTEPKAITAPAPTTAVNDIEKEAQKAIADMANDKDVAAIPGATIDILNILDSDSRLTRLYGIDPVIALREAKNIYLEKAGVTAPPPMPKSAPTSGGISGGSANLESLIEECHKHKPGTREFNRLADLVNAEMKKLY